MCSFLLDFICFSDMERENNPAHAASIAMTKEGVATLISKSHLFRATLVNQAMLRPIAAFYEWTCRWYMSKLLSKTEDDMRLLRLVPEHMVEDVVEFFDFLNRESKDTIVDGEWTGLLSFVCEGMQRRGAIVVQRTSVGELSTVGAGSTLIKNPHLRAKLADILHMFLPARQGDAFPLDAKHAFVIHPTLSSLLVPSLMKLYVDCGMFAQLRLFA
jgi:hypothetical protein